MTAQRTSYCVLHTSYIRSVRRTAYCMHYAYIRAYIRSVRCTAYIVYTAVSCTTYGGFTMCTAYGVYTLCAAYGGYTLCTAYGGYTLLTPYAKSWIMFTTDKLCLLWSKSYLVTWLYLLITPTIHLLTLSIIYVICIFVYMYTYIYILINIYTSYKSNIKVNMIFTHYLVLSKSEFCDV